MSAAEVGADVEAVDLSALDWDVLCEYFAHGEVGGGPAEWAIAYRKVRVCGCVGRSTLYLYCDACWAYRNGVGIVRCPYCGSVSGPMANVLRVERLRPPP